MAKHGGEASAGLVSATRQAVRHPAEAGVILQLPQRLLRTSRIRREAAMVVRTENVPCTRASFTSSADPRSSGSSRNLPASLVAVHAASAVDSIRTTRFCISLLKPPPPPLLSWVHALL